MGTGPAQLVGGTLFVCDVSIEHAEELETAVFDGYLEGVHSDGWVGDPRLIRLGFTASMAWWHAVTMPGWVGIMLPDEEEVDVQALFGRPAAAVKDVWVELQEFAMDRANEAKSLRSSLGL